jgi:nucleotide-binding universal stress UspA family protein
MSFKDIAVTLFSVKEDEAALAAAEVLAAASDADLTAILLELQPDPVYTMEGAMVGAMWAEVLSQAQKGFDKEKAALQARCKSSSRSIVIRELLVAAGLAAADAAVQARHADLTVMVRPGGSQPEDWRTSVFEGVLFGSGRPVMLVPPDWRGSSIGRKVAVAWNGKREAARALADAAPLLEAADEIVVITADARPDSTGVGPAPGADISAHLARRGLKVELRNLDGIGRSEADTLIAGAQAWGADVLVMGGYGRARLREVVFGGVTRAMVEKAPLPVLMSH